MMLNKQPKILVAAADGAHARFFDYSRDAKGGAARQVRVMNHPALQSKDLVSDRPGHGQGSNGGGTHAIEPRVSPHEAEETKFLHDVIAQIVKEAVGYDQLIIIAPPRALAVLRERLPRAERERVVLELNKDVLRMPEGDVAKLVEDNLSAAVLH
ncbi:host attachment protein [Aestuariivirga litoralis]|uniref:host attachment protein n=1 Tax=Aestuariivirga litoralis TaxID=2650924 RepID=UPI0018C60F9A|nr:host attachment protein [Aestuariivirga litoralis]MBG1232112.1 host attachment protein [Aestuariivirga litoralis]